MRVLVHADDCGLSAGLNKTILDCLKAGAIHGASVVAGGDHAQEAAKVLRCGPARMGVPPVGVHLNILEGRAVCRAEEIAELVHPDGYFRHSLGSLTALLARPFSRSRAALLKAVAKEWSAQVESIRRAVPDTPLYLDGHLHVHILPALRPVLLSLVEQYAIAYVRVPREERFFAPAPPGLRLVGTLRRELLFFWSRGLPGQLAKRGVRTPDYFIGAFCSGAMTLPRLAAGLAYTAKKASSEALVEIMTHPGSFAPEERDAAALKYGAFYSSENRARERAMLLSADFRNTLARYDASWQERSV